MSRPPKQRSHFGMAGHYAAISEFLLRVSAPSFCSEFLLRGWNAAVPAVDVGDDALVLDDDAGTVRRVQVKTSSGEESRNADGLLVETEAKVRARASPNIWIRGPVIFLNSERSSFHAGQSSFRHRIAKLHRSQFL